MLKCLKGRLLACLVLLMPVAAAAQAIERITFEEAITRDQLRDPAVSTHAQEVVASVVAAYETLGAEVQSFIDNVRAQIEAGGDEKRPVHAENLRRLVESDDVATWFKEQLNDIGRYALMGERDSGAVLPDGSVVGPGGIPLESPVSLTQLVNTALGSMNDDLAGG